MRNGMAFLSGLTAAATTDEVVTAARDYVRVWVEVLHRIPAGCPLEVDDSQSLFRTAANLEQLRQELRSSGATVGHELDITAEFFAAAANRIEELQPGALARRGLHE
jgi:hypothetical protein